ncbi:hypothetical protein ACFVUP_38435 [Streptomyces bacillaris]|uniref:hypothetical protein n=1 Tax=Streptomyces bacillaris TaxID=68179 RepID=UPI0036DC81DE
MTADREPENRPLRSGRTTGVIAAVMLSLIVVAGVVVVVWNLVGGAAPVSPASTSTAKASSSAAPTVPVPAEARSGCGLPGYDTDGTLTAPPAATWKFVGVFQAPQSSTAGPGRVSADGYGSCFAHTRAGAVLAAANYIADTFSDSLVGEMVDKAVLPGAGQQAAKDSLASGRGSTIGTRMSLQGIRLLTYTGTGATVDAALVADTGDMFGEVMTLVWADGDWKIQLTDTGQPQVPITQLTSLAGYLPWKAN